MADTTMTLDIRKTGTRHDLVAGSVLGAVCYLIAESLTPQQVANPGDHDLFLAVRLGFIYPPAVGLWVAWLQRSWRRALAGVLFGIVIGFAYQWLCANRNFLAIMVGFPCLLGGGFAALVGSSRSPWTAGFGARLGKGLLAGFVLGFVYMVVLNVTGILVGPPAFGFADFSQKYVAMMWRAGPVALGVASALFFVLIRWAVGLTRVRIVIADESE